jgi:hypothetical protein
MAAHSGNANTNDRILAVTEGVRPVFLYFRKGTVVTNSFEMELASGFDSTT